MLVHGGRLSEHGVAKLRARPLSNAELALLRAVKRGEGRRVVKAHERPVLSALAAWGLVADGSGNLLVAYVTPTNPYVWDSGSGITNPLASQTPTKVLMSQRGTTAEALDMQAIAAVA